MNRLLVCDHPEDDPLIHQVIIDTASQLNLILSRSKPASGLYLSFESEMLGLCSADESKLKPISVDFIGGTQGHRRRFGGGKNQDIAKAVGFKSKAPPTTILDLTAGLGRDGFVFAQLGAEVILFERHPWVHALLKDGLRRARQHPELEKIIQRMLLHYGSSLKQSKLPIVDVVYLDPMYPHQEKSALVKKDMRLFRNLVGADDDADNLLNVAQTYANKRIVVKRPKGSPYLNHQKPSSILEGKSIRFDIYL